MKSLVIAAMFTASGCCLEVVKGGDSIDAGGLFGCTPDSGATIYAHSPTELYRIDPLTWLATDVGSFGVDSMTDLAISPTNAIYVTSLNALYTINPATGAATLVMQDSANFNALTFLADGTLLGVSSGGEVSKVDPAHQTVTSVGTYGVDYGSSGDLVAVADGTIYATSGGAVTPGANDLLIKVDPKTGDAAPIGSIGFQNVWGLAYYDGRIIGFTSQGEIVDINPTTGAGTMLSLSAISYYGAGVSAAVAANCP